MRWIKPRKHFFSFFALKPKDASGDPRCVHLLASFFSLLHCLLFEGRDKRARKEFSGWECLSSELLVFLSAYPTTAKKNARREGEWWKVFIDETFFSSWINRRDIGKICKNNAWEMLLDIPLWIIPQRSDKGKAKNFSLWIRSSWRCTKLT